MRWAKAVRAKVPRKETTKPRRRNTSCEESCIFFFIFCCALCSIFYTKPPCLVPCTDSHAHRICVMWIPIPRGCVSASIECHDTNIITLFFPFVCFSCCLCKEPRKTRMRTEIKNPLAPSSEIESSFVCLNDDQGTHHTTYSTIIWLGTILVLSTLSLIVKFLVPSYIEVVIPERKYNTVGRGHLLPSFWPEAAA